MATDFVLLLLETGFEAFLADFAFAVEEDLLFFALLFLATSPVDLSFVLLPDLDLVCRLPSDDIAKI